MTTYIYKDNNKGKYEVIDGTLQWVAPIIFQCQASDILEAHEKFKEILGKDVTKMPHIGCIFS